MKKIVSYCLYGTKTMYLAGALQNAKMLQQFYPGWTGRFYTGQSVPADLLDALRETGCEVVPMSDPEDASATLWRFLPLLETDVEALLSRDCDSRLSEREANAVGAWLESGRLFHIMRDHPYHTMPILAGMWGCRGHLSEPDLGCLLQAFEPDGLKGTDQIFLARDVYPLVKRKACIHDAFFQYEWAGRRFPDKRKGLAFVGEVYDEHNQPNSEHREVLQRVYTRSSKRLKLYLHSLKGFGKAWGSGNRSGLSA